MAAVCAVGRVGCCVGGGGYQVVVSISSCLTPCVRFNASGVRVQFGLGVGGSVFFRIQEAVENPNFVGFSYSNGGTADHGDGDRILSGSGVLFFGSGGQGEYICTYIYIYIYIYIYMYIYIGAPT